MKRNITETLVGMDPEKPQKTTSLSLSAPLKMLLGFAEDYRRILLNVNTRIDFVTVRIAILSSETTEVTQSTVYIGECRI